MINTYQDYLTKEKAISFEQMEEIHKMILREISGDNEAIEIYGELLAEAFEYAAIRAEWTQMTTEQKMDKDPYRTASHNSFILNINILARYLRKNGRKSKWKNMLGDEESDSIFRKTIGDFACYLAFVNAVCMR